MNDTVIADPLFTAPVGDGSTHFCYEIHGTPNTIFNLVPKILQSGPDQTPNVTSFMNLAGFVGREKPISSINDKHFRIPKFPLATQYEKNDEASFCDVNSEWERRGGCECTTVMDLPDNVTVRFIISTVGEERNATHPIHIHGHSVYTRPQKWLRRVQQ